MTVTPTPPSPPPGAPEPLRVLLVEDSPEDAELTLRELRRNGYAPLHRRVDTPAGMVAALDAQSWDLVIADYAMPGFTGLDALALLKDRGHDIPFFIVSGTIGEETAVRAMKSGAHDYVMKGKLARLVPAIRRELRDAKERRERRRMEERIQHDALYDALTGLPNRALFMDRLGLALLRSQRHANFKFAVLFLDLDRFRVVIDTMGHAVGDNLLIHVARLLETCIRPGDTAARLGGDEFTILLEDVRDLGDPARVAERIRKSLSAPFRLEGGEIVLTGGIGIAMGDPQVTRAEDILRNANTAMHRSKAEGKDRQAVYDDAMHAQAVERLQIETDLRKAAERGELRVHYQPVVALDGGRLAGFEALVRWIHPQRGSIPPDVFIPVAEDSGLIVPVGIWVLRESCRQARAWEERRRSGEPLHVGVNLSGRQIDQPDIADRIAEILRETGLDPGLLRLEITESVIMSGAAAAEKALARIRALGVRMSIDDFGTGHSSLSRLHRFPVDVLKVDQSFVSRMSAHPENLEIVRAITAMAHAMRIAVVAEGVETSEQLAQLRALGCEFAQGNFFAKALPPEEAEALIARGPSW